MDLCRQIFSWAKQVLFRVKIMQSSMNFFFVVVLLGLCPPVVAGGGGKPAVTSTKVVSKPTSTGTKEIGDRRTDATGLHKSSIPIATLHVYTKTDEMRNDGMLRELFKLQSAVSADNPFSAAGIENERAGDINLAIAENLAASVIRKHSFDTEELDDLDKEYIVLGPNSHQNFFDLTSGNALFEPKKNIIVSTNLGEISIGAGSIVCILKPEPGVVSIYDLHDASGKNVCIKIGTEILTLSPGKQITLSNQTKEELEFEKITPARRIAYRKLQQSSLQSGTKVYSSEFSIPSAMLHIKPLQMMLLSDNKDDRKIADELIKDFVILDDLSAGSEQYKMPTKPEFTKISTKLN